MPRLPDPRSLRFRLVLILGLALAPPTVFGVSGIYADYRADRAAVERALSYAGRLAASEHKAVLLEARHLLSMLASRPEIREASHPACQATLAEAMAAVRGFQDALVIGADGRALCAATVMQQPVDFADRAWFKQVTAERRFVVSDILTSRLRPGTTVVVAQPIADVQGADPPGPARAVAMGIDLGVLTDQIGRLDLPDSAFVALIDPSGQVVVLDGRLPDGIDAAQFSALSGADQASDSTRLSQARGRSQSMTLVASRLPQTRLDVVFGVPSADHLDWLLGKLARNLAAPMLIWMVALATAWLAADRMVVRWLLQLEAMARSFADGARNVRLGRFDGAPSEFRRVRASLLRMLRKIDRRTEEVRQALAQRESLIKVIHHRVKNNMQVVSSLLNLQARTIRDPAGQQAVVAMRSRINALALVHRGLYESHDLQYINLGEFIDGLCGQLVDLLRPDNRDIGVRTIVPRRMVSADTAVPLAMLITEAVTKSFRQDYEEQTSGAITVQIEDTAAGGAVLTISDNGAGIAEEAVEESEQNRLARSLMEGFARQLRGTLSITVGHGTVVRVEIPKLA